MLYCTTNVLIEVYLQSFTESVSLRDIIKPTSCAEISSPSSSYHKAVRGAPNGPALTAATSELTNSNGKTNAHKSHYSLLRKRFRANLSNLILFLNLKFRKPKVATPINNYISQHINTSINKRSHYTGQTSLKPDTHYEELQLDILAQNNKRNHLILVLYICIFFVDSSKYVFILHWSR